MKIADSHIVVDGYNLARRRGTGIKSYGLTLVRALAGLGARVSVLWGAPGSRIPLVREALLYERDPEGEDPKAGWSAVRPLVRGLVGIPSRARGHVPTGLVRPPAPSDDLAPIVHRYYSVPGLYAAAHRLFRHTGITLRASLPDRADVWHATCPLPVDVPGARAVTTVHDLIPLRLPWASLDNRQLFYRTVQRALRRSAVVLAVSEHTKKDLVELFGADPSRIHVTYQPCPVPPAAAAGGEDAPLYGLRRGEYALFVGAIEPKKNLGRLLLAWRALETKVPLVVGGGKGWLWKEGLKPAEPLLAAGRVVFIPHVPREHLRRLYAGALFLAFPSLYEGFGLPPLEAMANGCPVLASNAASLPEVCGDAAVTCDPYDVDGLADRMKSLLADEGLRRRLIEKGRERAAFFSEENYRKRLAEGDGRVIAS